MQITPRRCLAATFVSITIATSLTACGSGSSGSSGSSGAASSPISIGVGVDGTYAAFFIADADGMFKKAGLNVKVVQFSAGGDAVQAIAGKQVQLAGSSTTTAVTMMSQNKNLRAMFDYMNSDTYLKVVANPKIKSAADIKKIGVVPGVSEYLAHKYFDSEGINSSGVKFVKADPPELPSLTKKGDLDAYLLWEPWPTTGKAMGLHVLTDTGKFGQPTTQVLVGDDDWVKEHRSEIVKIAKVLKQASAKIEKDPTGTAKTVGGMIKTPTKTALSEIKQVNYVVHGFTAADMKSFKDQSAYFVKTGAMKSAPDLSTTVLKSWYADNVK